MYNEFLPRKYAFLTYTQLLVALNRTDFPSQRPDFTPYPTVLTQNLFGLYNCPRKAQVFSPAGSESLFAQFGSPNGRTMADCQRGAKGS